MEEDEVTEITEDEEEDTEEEEIGDFQGGIADLVGVASMEREEAGEDREMRADFASVRNSTGFEVDTVPITDSEPPIGDNVCPTIIISFGMIYLQCPIDRAIKQLKVVVEMKPT